MATEILYFPDNDAIFWGTGRDVQAYSDGTDLVFADGGSGGTVDFQCDVAFATVTGITTLTVTTVTATTATVTGTLTPPVVADGNLTPGILVAHNFAVADASTGSTDYVLVNKFEILDIVVQKRGGAGCAGDDVQLQTGAGLAITNAIDLNIADATVTRVGTIDDTRSTVLAGGTLRVAWTKVTDPECQVTVIGILRA